jgi:hypothetical protein
MKLAAGNQNLMKKAMRVNKTSTLAVFNNSTGDKEQVKYRTGFVPVEKDPNAVPSPAMSIWKRDSYEPANMTPMRPGADDHLRYKSRGM